GRAAQDPGAHRQDRAVHHPPDQRGDLPRSPRRRVFRATGHHQGRDRGRSAGAALARPQARVGLRRARTTRLAPDRGRGAQDRHDARRVSNPMNTATTSTEIRSAAGRPASSYWTRNENWLLGTISMAIFLVVWELAVALVWINPLFTSSPSRIIRTGYQLFTD